MNFRFIIFLTFTILTISTSFTEAQERRASWIYFQGKPDAPGAPEEYYSANALERRAQLALNPFEFTDLPVSTGFLDSISMISQEVIGSSRWLNAALVIATDDQLALISNLPFVISVCPSSIEGSIIADIDNQSSGKVDYSLADKQLEWHEADILRQNNLSGKGIRIAVLDGGFPGVNAHPAFSHLFENNQIIDTWDFAKDSPDVYRFNNHGTAVLSCIAGYYGDQPTGMAPDAEFLLARTELAGEPWREELYWIQAAEWADQKGAHIISSSLGYTYQRYFISDMTGRDSPVARAANIAARKGILVVNCIGNEGDSDWKYSITPADADSVLSVGGIDPYSGLHIPFSSFGPNMSGKMKPNVMASGLVLAASPKKWKNASGTSFSTPLIAGYAACVWQQNPGSSNMDIFDLIQKSGHLYPYYDFANGFGIPMASGLDLNDKKNNPETQRSLKASIVEGGIKVEIDRADLYDFSKSHYLYFNLRNDDDKIVRYGIYQMNSDTPIFLPIKSSENIRSCYLRTDISFQIFKF